MTSFFSRLVGTTGLAVALAACGDQGSSGNLSTAREFKARGDSVAAYNAVKAALQSNPDSVEGRVLLAELLVSQGENTAAQAEFKRALAAGAQAQDVWPKLAHAMLADRQYQKLIDESEQVPNSKDWPDLQVSVATAYAHLGDRNAANDIVKRVLSEHPDNAAAELLSIQLAVGHTDTDETLTRLNDLVRKAPDNADAWFYLGRAQMLAKGNLATARSAFEKVLALRPNAVDAHTALVTLAIHSRDVERASAAVHSMRRALPQHPLSRLMDGQVAILSKQFDRASELGTQLLKSHPQWVPALQLTGISEMQLGLFLQAESHLSKALSLAPANQLTRQILADVYVRTGEPEKALTTIGPLVESSQPTAESLITMAESLLLLGRARSAAAYFDQAAKLKPADARVGTAVALNQFSRGEQDLALNSLQSIAQKDAGNTADLALISLNLQRGDRQSALAAIKALTAKAPKSPEPDNLAGRVYLLDDKRADARERFEAALTKDPTYFAATAALVNMDLEDGVPDRARQRLETLVRDHPHVSTAAITLSDLRLRQGATRKDIVPILEAAIRQNPQDSALRVTLINNYILDNNPKAAAAAAQQAAAILPDSPVVIEALGNALIATSEVNQAITAFSKLAAKQPQSAAPLVRLATAYLAAQNPRQALSTAIRAVELDPFLPDARRVLISTSIANKQPDQALKAARKLQEQHKDSAVGHLLEGDLEAEQQQWAKAIEAYSKGLNRAQVGKLPTRLHLMMLMAGRKADADRFASQWMRDHPSDGAFAMYLGDAAIASNDFVAAEARYAKAAELLPESALALNNQAFARLVIGKPGALEIAKRAHEQQPNNPMILDTVAQALAATGDLKQALDYSRRAVIGAPNDGGLKLTYARLLIKSGDKTKARELLAEISTLGSRFPKQDEVGKLMKSLNSGG